MKLGVNIDHIATLRQLRHTPYPDLVEAAQIVEKAGGNQITVHLREDRRHIQDADVIALKKILKVDLNLEMSIAPEIVKIAKKIRPTWTCLVPEKRQEVTTEGGLDLKKNKKQISKVIQELKKQKILVSLFVEPESSAIQLSAELGADAVELHTGKYCLAAQKRLGKKSEDIFKTELKKHQDASELAFQLGIRPHAGHGLDYQNIRPIVDLGLIQEFNIGHSIVCRAAIVGLERAVREMVSAIQAP